MSHAALHAWDVDAKVWRKLICNAEGKLIIDPSEIFENDPTCDEHGKAPDSDWACVHENDASAHHARYTDAESRAAIGDLFNAGSFMLKDLNCSYHSITSFRSFSCRYAASDDYKVTIYKNYNRPELLFEAYELGVGVCNTVLRIWYDSAWRTIATEAVVDVKISDHAAVSDAHHERYTDAEAIAAVGYGGTKYWSCPGVHFDGLNPANEVLLKTTGGYLRVTANDTALVAAVSLPDGATVTAVVVHGNEAAGAETWTLQRIRLSDLNTDAMASANINTLDASISEAVIDNSTYAYSIYTSTLDANDEVWGVIIQYTI